MPVIARAGIALAVLLAGPALAAEDRGGRPSDRALAPLVACRPIADPRARASCYDAALDKLQQSVADRAVVVMDREQVKANFGFGGQPLKKSPAAKAAPEQVEEITSTVSSVTSYGYDMWGIRIASGAFWRTTDTGLVFPPKPGTEIKIKRGILGGYVMYIGKNQAVRVARAR